MADPATVLTAAKAALAAAGERRTWTGAVSALAALCLPFILAVMCIVSVASGGAGHNQAAVRLAFSGGVFSAGMPEDYRAYISQIQEGFRELDGCLGEINGMAEGAGTDALLVKAVFYSLYFGAAEVRLEPEDYRGFADCFVRYESRARTVKNPDGTETEEKFTVAVPITDMPEVYRNLADRLGKAVAYERQANAISIWHLVTYGTVPPLEGDGFAGWENWEGQEAVPAYDRPASEVGEAVAGLARSRLGHPYSQSRRGRGDYVDCSYLTMWCYRQVGIQLPGTAAEQGRHCVENGLAVPREDLQPGDLVFWSHKPNGRFMNITHTGVYAGNGMVVDASSSRGEVVCRKLFDGDRQVLYGRPS